MSNIENESRAQFEVYAADHYLLCERSDARNEHQNDEYIDSDMQVAWEAWQASRQALVMELPTALDYTGCGEAIKVCRAAIESQGVKCK